MKNVQTGKPPRTPRAASKRQEMCSGAPPRTSGISPVLLSLVSFSSGQRNEKKETGPDARVTDFRARLSALGVCLALLATPEFLRAQTTRPENQPDLDAAFKDVATILGVEGVRKDEVFTLRLPRDDQIVFVDDNVVPTAAGLESVLHIYWCACGGYKSVGQFVLFDYEANDVIDALRKDYSGHGALFEVGTVSPMFLNDRPRVVSLRFQGEGDAVELAKVLRETMKWIGEERGKRSNQE